SVLERDHVRELHLHRQAAVGAMAGETDPDEHEIAVRAELDGLRLEVRVGVEPAPMLLADRLYAAIFGVVGVLARVDEHAVIQPRRRRRLLAVEPFVPDANEVFVVLVAGHRTAPRGRAAKPRARRSRRDARARAARSA